MKVRDAHEIYRYQGKRLLAFGFDKVVEYLIFRCKSAMSAADFERGKVGSGRKQELCDTHTHALGNFGQVDMERIWKTSSIAWLPDTFIQVCLLLGYLQVSLVMLASGSIIVGIQGAIPSIIAQLGHAIGKESCLNS